uniref:Cell division control protein 21 n=1 Tax=Pyrococcus furiosus (strain ATCC 43587 / DSM 3638 / JCM 8422 / Vc1) TaxID=186497 RepID=UPI0006B87EC1|nr:Chain A, Cell division control protein 21 [Pyrococcus furiosus DSM 3638]4YWK_B Chain B, Cell division control protein 21 [Pyrococcus furiosus DSM 3638]
SVDREEMIERFANFLREYTDEDGNPVYRGKITDLLTITPKRSVAIDWMHLNSFDSELAHEVIENPEEGISAAEDAIQIVLREDFQREDVGKIHARFYNLPETLMVKDIGAEHINKLIQVEGIVTRVGEIKPFQSFRIQDRPETLKGGEMPRFIDGILLDDIVDVALPGDRVIVTGILRVVLEKREKTPIFRKILEVNHIEPVSKEI